MNSRNPYPSRPRSGSRNNQFTHRARRTHVRSNAPSLTSAATISRSERSIQSRNTLPSTSLDLASQNQLNERENNERGAFYIEDETNFMLSFRKKIRTFYVLEYVVLIVFFILLMGTQLFDGNFGAILIVFEIITAVHFFILIRNHFILDSAQEKRENMYHMLEDILYLIFLFLLKGGDAVKDGLDKGFAIVTSIILINYLAKTIQLYIDNKSSKWGFNRSVNRFIFIIKLLIIAEIVLLLIRTSEKTNLNWIFAFIPLFAIAFWLLVWEVYFLKIALSREGRILWSAFNKQKYLGFGWLFGAPLIWIVRLVWITLSFSLFLANEKSYNDEDRPFLYPFLGVVIISLISVVYTHLCEERIFVIAKYFASLFDLSATDKEKIHALAKKIKDEHQRQIEDTIIPEFFTKVSNAFFKMPTKQEIKDEEKLKKLKDKTKKVAAKDEKDVNKDPKNGDKKIKESSNNNSHQGIEINQNHSITSLADLEKNDNTRCVVCFDKNQDAVYLPCGHGGVCYRCAREVIKSKGECHLCRCHVRRLAKIAPIDGRNDLVKVLSVIKASQLISIKV